MPPVSLSRFFGYVQNLLIVILQSYLAVKKFGHPSIFVDDDGEGPVIPIIDHHYRHPRDIWQELSHQKKA